MSACRQQQGVPVRRLLRHVLGGDVAAGAGPVLDDDRLPEHWKQALRDQAREQVVRAARRQRYDDANRPSRPGRALRPSLTGRQGKRQGANDERSPREHVLSSRSVCFGALKRAPLSWLPLGLRKGMRGANEIAHDRELRLAPTANYCSAVAITLDVSVFDVST